MLSSQNTEEGADQSTTTAGDADATTESTEATDAGDDPDQADLPQNLDLDVEQRHPNGTTLRLSGLSFDGNDIFIEAEVINGGPDEITFHDGSDESFSLRLVDDAGEEYGFIEAAHEETPFLDDGAIYVAPGETVSGTFAFRGPLHGLPDQLQVVTNVLSDDIEGFNLDDQYEGAYDPGFVVPFELTWD